MIIIHLNSQLGNQMFQYALYRKLQNLGLKVKFDVRYYQKYPNHFGLDVFNLHINIATEKDIYKSRDEYRGYFDRVRRRFFGKRQTIFDEVNSKTLQFKPEVLKVKRGYIDGYWQTEKYFSDIREILLKDFQFSKPAENKNIELLEMIRNKISISIHVRRGDYENGFPLMPKEYYSNAIEYFLKKYNNAFFVVFSNDIEWSKENLHFNNGVYVDWNTGKASYKDMFLMTQCKHNIIANSSFSWWGAWLNQNTEKEVIAPSIWLYHQETPDIYCKEWKII